MPPTFKLRCACCGTVQEAELGNRHASCRACTHPLAGSSAASESVSASPRAAPGSQPAPRSHHALAELGDQAAAPETLRAVDEFRTLHGQLTWLETLVPFLGPWLVTRSDISPTRKHKLQLLAIGFTVLAIAGIVAALPPLAAPPVPLSERVRSQLDVLAHIARAFRDKHGAYPDAGTWKRTANQPDLRFVDPWSRPYDYVPTHDGGVTIGTLGRDGAPGGNDEDADVSIQLPPPPAPGRG
jgi:general secretion pathway protein G